jgi:lipopolysaccharide transport system permease protein
MRSDRGGHRGSRLLGDPIECRQIAAASAALVERRVVRRQAREGWVPIDVAELWRYRELLFFLAQRDIKVRYKQTLLGVAWAVLQPVLTMVVFSIFFGRLVGVPSDGLPYPVYTLCALLPWQLFAYGLTQSSSALVQDAQMIKKVYFPRLILPLASVIAGLVDFAIAFVVLLMVMLYYRIVPGPAVFTLPVLAILSIVSALAIGFWLSALNVKYRDVRYAIPFLAQLCLFVTPVAYPSSVVPDKWRTLYALNPLVGVIDGFRWVLLNGPAPSPVMLVVSSLTACVVLVAGLFYFRRTERSFADII